MFRRPNPKADGESKCTAMTRISEVNFFQVAGSVSRIARAYDSRFIAVFFLGVFATLREPVVSAFLGARYELLSRKVAKNAKSPERYDQTELLPFLNTLNCAGLIRISFLPVGARAIVYEYQKHKERLLTTIRRPRLRAPFALALVRESLT